MMHRWWLAGAASLLVAASTMLLTAAVPTGGAVDFGLPGQTYFVGNPDIPAGGQSVESLGGRVVASVLDVPATLPDGDVLVFSGCPGSQDGKTAGWVRESVVIVVSGCSESQFLSDTHAVSTYVAEGTDGDVSAGLIRSANVPTWEAKETTTVEHQLATNFADAGQSGWTEFHFGSTGKSAWWQSESGPTLADLNTAIRNGSFRPQVW